MCYDITLIEEAEVDKFFGNQMGKLKLEFFRGGVQQIQLRTEGRENGDLGGGSP
jgi:hypothetical protein